MVWCGSVRAHELKVPSHLSDCLLVCYAILLNESMLASPHKRSTTVAVAIPPPQHIVCNP